MTYATIYPTLTYGDAGTAIDFLTEAFGFERHAVYNGDGGDVRHAELRLGNGLVMLGSANASIPATKGRAGGIYVVVDDPDAHYERAVGAGAEVVRDLTDEDYGSRGYTARDLEGNVWSFGTYRPEAA